MSGGYNGDWKGRGEPKWIAEALAHLEGVPFSASPPTADDIRAELGCTLYKARVLRGYIARGDAVNVVAATNTAGLGSIVFVVPDSHAGPHQDLSRFTWLGRAIEEHGRRALALGVVFRVVWIGDTADYHSLSSYDRGKAGSWNSTYKADVAAHEQAMRLTRSAVSDEVWRAADKHWTEGNHEHRAVRYMQDNPEMQGVLRGPWDVMQDQGIRCHAYTEIVSLDGVGYSHMMQSPGSGRAVSGVNQARSMLIKGFRSMVVGHSHKYDVCVQHDVYGKAFKALVCGCYFEHRESYAGQGNDAWWRGLVVLDNVADGNFDERPIRMDTVRAMWGAK
jgi:hypothetical protein